MFFSYLCLSSPKEIVRIYLICCWGSLSQLFDLYLSPIESSEASTELPLLTMVNTHAVSYYLNNNFLFKILERLHNVPMSLFGRFSAGDPFLYGIVIEPDQLIFPYLYYRYLLCLASCFLTDCGVYQISK